MTLEGQDMRYTAEEQDSLWDALGPSMLETLRDPGFLLHLKRPGGLLLYGTVQLPAMMSLNIDMSVQQRS